MPPRNRCLEPPNELPPPKTLPIGLRKPTQWTPQMLHPSPPFPPGYTGPVRRLLPTPQTSLRHQWNQMESTSFPSHPINNMLLLRPIQRFRLQPFTPLLLQLNFSHMNWPVNQTINLCIHHYLQTYGGHNFKDNIRKLQLLYLEYQYLPPNHFHQIDFLATFQRLDTLHHLNHQYDLELENLLQTYIRFRTSSNQSTRPTPPSPAFLAIISRTLLIQISI